MRVGKLSPLVRRLVAEHNVDVAQLKGTGMGGRITKEDVLSHVADRGGAAVATPSKGDETSMHALMPLRRTIAEHLTRSAREIPAAWTMVEADVTGLVAFRGSHREAFERSMGVPLTFLPFAAMAVAQALQDNPMLNGRWDGDHVTLNHRVHLGIAVSTEGGLIVPVVHEADLLNVEGLAVKINEIVEAARGGTLKLDDVQGGTFTLNNTGALGSVISAPIINHPQAAIMTTEAIIKRPVVVESDAIAARSIMNLCMTFDHRVCDGAEAGRFLADVKRRLEAIGKDSQLL
jgi:2-oxoisovalerate dehydrogenase E2 component (dihydrolipoyl transacylase)